MLSFGNKEFRNLQEQVLKNAQDIETLKGRENLQIVIVEELPEEGNPNYIYLVPNNDEEESNVYNEYIWLADSEEYEKIGGVSIDLTNYVTTDTEQTVTGSKTFSDVTTFTDDVNVSKITTSSGNLNLSSASGEIVCECFFKPSTNNALDLGTSALNWKDLYLSGKVCAYDSSYPSTNYWYIYAMNQFNLMIVKNGTNRFMFQSNQFSPADYQNPQCNLGSANYSWKDLYLAGSISDGANTVSVANIASKTTSTYQSGTFDSNGESTINVSDGWDSGLFIFAYGNCQCIAYLTFDMVQSANLTPIRIACPMIYNSDTVNGWLQMTRNSGVLTLTITDGTNHVDSGYAWTLTKTNLL